MIPQSTYRHRTAQPMDLAQLTRDLEALRDEAVSAAGAAPETAAIDALEIDVLGKKGRLTAILRGIGQLPPEDRPRVGAVANEVRGRVEAALGEARASLGAVELERRIVAEAVDVTLPGRTVRRGTLHPSIEAMREIEEIFEQFGFVVYESPEIETDVTNFQMLNIPADHPARDLWDTMYLDVPGHLLRTHTSPGQIHLMRTERPPIRALLPGRCFRYEATDASHGSEFFQVEGLMIDEGTTLADLKGLLDQFAHALFGAGKRTRFRPGYYPFTEPSVAFDVECLVCGGGGCPACGRSGWMTILGAGMVHPVVLRYGGLDPERYQGFAFGMGPERIKMLRHGITDLRLFLENDLRFLGSFR
jgi:phenylalanyl-tRNA synthetase alpha chain